MIVTETSMAKNEDMHIGRSWSAPDPFLFICGCEPLQCGLVSFSEANRLNCDQHSLGAFQTIRTGHYESECKPMEGNEKGSLLFT